MQAIIRMSPLPFDEALHLCRQPAPVSLFTIHYECSTLICLMLIFLWLEDLFSLCDFRALDLTPSSPEICRNCHCHPAPKLAQFGGKKKRKYEGFAPHVHVFFFREHESLRKSQSWKSGEQTGSYQDQKRDLSSICLATGDAASPLLPSELPKQANYLANKNKSQKDLLKEELNTHCKS